MSRHAALSAKARIRFVWCYSKELDVEEINLTRQIIAKNPELKPQFVLVTFSSLIGLFSVVATADVAYL